MGQDKARPVGNSDSICKGRNAVLIHLCSEGCVDRLGKIFGPYTVAARVGGAPAVDSVATCVYTIVEG